jgi:uncharacterized protein
MYKDTRALVKAQERTNRFTGKKVSEAIDDARDEIITDLLETATAFIEQGRTYYSRNGNGLPVKDAIAKFLDSN